MITVQEAQQLILQNATLSPFETIFLEDALGKTLAENIYTDRDYPPFNRAAMDGYAFRLKDYQKRKSLFIAGELFAGHSWGKEIPEGHCIKIMTGAATPHELNCIVQVELAQASSSLQEVSFSEIELKPWQNIAKKGEDAAENELVLKESTVLHPTEIAILAVLGKKEIKVRKVPKVAILSTGDELVVLGQPVSAFQIRDSNAYSLLAFFQTLQIPVAKRTIVKDHPQALREALEEVIDYDIIVLSGGVSMGDADYVPQTLQELEVEKIFHKVQLKPGKPLWFGKSTKGGVVFGLPGNPLSCQVCFKLFIEPYIRQSFGQSSSSTPRHPLASVRKKKAKLDEYFPVKLEGGKLYPILFNGSGDITSTLGSTGLALHPKEEEDIQANTLVEYLSWI